MLLLTLLVLLALLLFALLALLLLRLLPQLLLLMLCCCCLRSCPASDGSSGRCERCSVLSAALRLIRLDVTRRRGISATSCNVRPLLAILACTDGCFEAEYRRRQVTLQHLGQQTKRGRPLPARFACAVDKALQPRQKLVPL